jgi:hypothetical protein
MRGLAWLQSTLPLILIPDDLAEKGTLNSVVKQYHPFSRFSYFFSLKAPYLLIYPGRFADSLTRIGMMRQTHVRTRNA